MANNIVTIRVIRTPAGEAPLKVRKQWTGVVISPAVFRQGNEGIAFGLVSGQPMPERRCYIVPAVAAIEALRVKSPLAAEWFIRRYPPGMSFTFGADEVEVIENN